MKRKVLYLTILIIGICSLMAKEGNKESSGLSKWNKLLTKNKVLDVVGESTNSGMGDTVAIAYALGKGGLTNDMPGFIKPQMVEVLSDQVFPARPGPLETTDEVRRNIIKIN